MILYYQDTGDEILPGDLFSFTYRDENHLGIITNLDEDGVIDFKADVNDSDFTTEILYTFSLIERGSPPRKQSGFSKFIQRIENE